MRSFVGIDLGVESAPDETTACKFRHLLQRHKLGKTLLTAVNDHLRRSGIKIGKGTIVDATIISTPSSTKNQDGKRDPQMHQTAQGQQWYFGIKAHVGVDRKKDLIISGVQNVYPDDSEAVLATHPDVAEVAVIGLPSERWGETPIAIFVLSATPADVAGRQPDAAALRDSANARLGRQQRLAAVQFRASLLRNPNGKVLKRERPSEYAAAP